MARAVAHVDQALSAGVSDVVLVFLEPGWLLGSWEGIRLSYQNRDLEEII